MKTRFVKFSLLALGLLVIEVVALAIALTFPAVTHNKMLVMVLAVTLFLCIPLNIAIAWFVTMRGKHPDA